MITWVPLVLVLGVLLFGELMRRCEGNVAKQRRKSSWHIQYEKDRAEWHLLNEQGED